MEAVEDREFQTFRNEAMRLLSSIQSRGKELSATAKHSNLHLLGAPVLLQHLCNRHFNSHSNQHQVGTKGQHQPRGQPTSFVVADEQQPEPSRLLTFTLTLTQHFSPLSAASATLKERQLSISGNSSFFGNLKSVISYQ